MGRSDLSGIHIGHIKSTLRSDLESLDPLDPIFALDLLELEVILKERSLQSRCRTSKATLKAFDPPRPFAQSPSNLPNDLIPTRRETGQSAKSVQHPVLEFRIQFLKPGSLPSDMTPQFQKPRYNLSHETERGSAAFKHLARVGKKE